MKKLSLFLALALIGCANTELKSVKEMPVVYEAQAKGNHAEVAGCLVDALQASPVVQS